MSKEFTGRKMLLVTVSAFAVIIGVNLTLAFKAVSTFPGLETKNSYVASQRFDAERAAQLALGWKAEVTFSDGVLRLDLTGRDGQPVRPAELTATIGRATGVRDDQTPGFVFDGTGYVAPMELGGGNWYLRLLATAEDGTRFRQRLAVFVQ